MRFRVRPGGKITLSSEFSWIDRGAPNGKKDFPLYQPSRLFSVQYDSEPIAQRFSRLLRRKENSPRGHDRRFRIHLRCRKTIPARFRNFNRIPFPQEAAVDGPEGPSRAFVTVFTCVLGSTNPVQNAFTLEPFSTSVFIGLI